MADIQTLNIIIGANTQQADAGLQKVSKELANTAMAAQKVDSSIAKSSTTIAKSTTNFTGLNRVIQDLPFGFIAISNNLEQLLPAAGALGLAFSAIVATLSFLQLGFQNWTRGIGDNKDAVDEAVDAFERLDEATKKLRDDIGETPTATEAATTALDGLKNKIGELTKQYESLGKSIQISAGFTPAGVDLALAQAQVQSQVQKSIDETQQKIKEGSKKINDERIAQAKADGLAIGRVNMDLIENNAKLQIDADADVISDKKKSFDKRIAALREKLEQENIIIRTELNKELSAALGNEAKIAAAKENYRFASLKGQQDFNQKLNSLNQEAADAAAKLANVYNPININIKGINKKFIDAIAKETGDHLNATINKELDKGPGIKIKPFIDFDFVEAQVKNISTILNETLKPAIDAVFDAFATGQNAFDALGHAIKSIITKLAAAVVEAAIFSLIINTITGGAAGLAGFGKIFSALSGIPKFATGGIITRPTLLIAGEQGPEEIKPLNRISGNSSGVSLPERIELFVSGNNLFTVLKRDANGRYYTF